MLSYFDEDEEANVPLSHDLALLGIFVPPLRVGFPPSSLRPLDYRAVYGQHHKVRGEEDSSGFQLPPNSGTTKEDWCRLRPTSREKMES